MAARIKRPIAPSPYLGSKSEAQWESVGNSIEATKARIDEVMAIMRESTDYVREAINKEKIK